LAWNRQDERAFDPAQATTEEIHAHMLDLAREISVLHASGNRPAHADALRAEYQALSQLLGGDDPANSGRAQPGAAALPATQPGPQMLVNPACGGAPTTTTLVGTGGLIALGEIPTQYTCVVSGLGTFLWDVDLNTTITHTACGDIDMTLTSPSGTKVVITTDNGGTNDDVFNGTTWNDNISDTVADHNFTNLVTATPLNPEGRMAAFRGENPNGTWVLTITDDTNTNSGTLSAWSLDLTTATAPVTSTSTFSKSPMITIPATAGGSYPDTQSVSGVGSVLTGVKLYLEVQHSAPRDLDITLKPPTGAQIKLTTDNGGTNDNVFDGTTFDPHSTVAVTDAPFADGVVLVACAPEGSFDNWLGINPNGTWTINVTDDSFLEGGLFKRWDVIVTTASSAVVTSAPSHFVGTTGPFPDSGTGGPNTVVFNVLASGLGTYLWDVDLTTALDHTQASDLDVTLTSPAGTTVNLSSDLGTSESFNGTLWDDNANDPVSDHVFNGTPAATLSPEGRLSAFRGENPNGTWSLTIVDDMPTNGGTLTSWSLGLSHMPSAPPVVGPTVFSVSPNLAIADVATTNSTQVVAGVGTSLVRVTLYTEIMHTYSADLDVQLISPAGTSVTVTTDNGLTNDNNFNGTLWDPSVLDTVTDHTYTNLVVATPLSPEGSFDNFNGQNPNGTWTLSITDDEAADTGTLVRWDLNITTCNSSIATVDCQHLPTASQGCQSVASFTGTPSDAGAPFSITFSGLNVGVNGTVFYGITGPVNVTWSPQSNLCVKSPTQRLSTVPGASGSTGGTVGMCNGSYTFDMNAIIQGSGLLGTPMAQGTSVNIQAWQRDAASSKTTNLSDALSFVVGP
jgi:subtilisin-like proprotein convertase family protein